MNNSYKIITPGKSWQAIDFKELSRYKDLLYFLVKRDIQVIYKQTVLGFAWAFIQPFFMMVIFSVVFGAMAKMPSDGIPYPLFSYAALVPWIYFSQALTGSTNSLVASANLLSKVYFPRIIIPIVPVLAKLIDFLISFIILFALMAYYGVSPNINILFLPYLIVLMILTASGIGMWLSALAIQYRDIKFTINFLVQALMYAAPVVWPASLLLEKFGQTSYLLYGLYPMAGVIEGFRAALLGQTEMPWELIGMGSISALLLFVSGAFYFRRKERIFADVA